MDRLGNDFDIPRDALACERLVLNQFGKAAARHVVHGKVMPTLALADIVDRDNIRVLQAGRRLRFGAKTLHEYITGKFSEEQRLDRHDPIQAPLPRPINDPHPTARDFFDQLVITETMRMWRGGAGGSRRWK